MPSPVWCRCCGCFGAYSLTFSGTGPWLGNLDKVLLLGVARDAADPNTKIPETVFFMFQMTFAIITPALIVGAFAERMRFGAVLLFTVLWLLPRLCACGALGLGRRLACQPGACSITQEAS